MDIRRIAFFAAVFAAASAGRAEAGSFSMAEAVEYALRHSPAVERSLETLKASESSVAAARSTFGPTAGASYGLTRYSKERPSRYEKNSAAITLKVSQPLFRGFELLNSYQKACLQKERQEIQLRADRLELALSVQTAFISYLQAAASVRSDRKALERSEAQLAMAKTSWEIGLRPRLDVLQAESDHAAIEARLIRHENERDVWRSRLDSLLDIRSGEAEYRGDLSIREFRRTLDACLRRAMENRPELLMARKSADIAYKDLGITRASFWPQLSAVAGWTTSGSHPGAAGTKYAAKDYSYAEVGLSIDWTLFTSGKRIHLTRQAEHQVAAMEAAVRSAVNSCGHTVRSSFLTAQDAFRSVKVSRKAAERAQAAYEDARMRYELQSGSYIDLLTARASLSDAELAEISSRGECLKALAALYSCMGELHPGLSEGSGNAEAPAGRKP